MINPLSSTSSSSTSSTAEARSEDEITALMLRILHSLQETPKMTDLEKSGTFAISRKDHTTREKREEWLAFEQNYDKALMEMQALKKAKEINKPRMYAVSPKLFSGAAQEICQRRALSGSLCLLEVIHFDIYDQLCFLNHCCDSRLEREIEEFCSFFGRGYLYKSVINMIPESFLREAFQEGEIVATVDWLTKLVTFERQVKIIVGPRIDAVVFLNNFEQGIKLFVNMCRDEHAEELLHVHQCKNFSLYFPPPESRDHERTLHDLINYTLFLHKAFGGLRHHINLTSQPDPFLALHQALKRIKSSPPEELSALKEQAIVQHRNLLKRQAAFRRSWQLTIQGKTKESELRRDYYISEHISLERACIIERIDEAQGHLIHLFILECFNIIERDKVHFSETNIDSVINRFQTNISFLEKVCHSSVCPFALPPLENPFPPYLQKDVRGLLTSIRADIVSLLRKCIFLHWRTYSAIQVFRAETRAIGNALSSILHVNKDGFENIKIDLMKGMQSLFHDHFNRVKELLMKLDKRDLETNRARYEAYLKECFFRETIYVSLLYIVANDALAIADSELRLEILTSTEHLYPEDIVVDYANVEGLQEFVDHLLSSPPSGAARTLSESPGVSGSSSEGMSAATSSGAKEASEGSSDVDTVDKTKRSEGAGVGTSRAAVRAGKESGSDTFEKVKGSSSEGTSVATSSASSGAKEASEGSGDTDTVEKAKRSEGAGVGASRAAIGAAKETRSDTLGKVKDSPLGRAGTFDVAGVPRSSATLGTPHPKLEGRSFSASPSEGIKPPSASSTRTSSASISSGTTGIFGSPAKRGKYFPAYNKVGKKEDSKDPIDPKKSQKASREDSFAAAHKGAKATAVAAKKPESSSSHKAKAESSSSRVRASDIPLPIGGEKREKYIARLLKVTRWKLITPPGGSHHEVLTHSGEKLSIPLGGKRKEFGDDIAKRFRKDIQGLKLSF